MSFNRNRRPSGNSGSEGRMPRRRLGSFEKNSKNLSPISSSRKSISDGSSSTMMEMVPEADENKSIASSQMGKKKSTDKLGTF